MGLLTCVCVLLAKNTSDRKKAGPACVMKDDGEVYFGRSFRVVRLTGQVFELVKFTRMGPERCRF